LSPEGGGGLSELPGILGLPVSESQPAAYGPGVTQGTAALLAGPIFHLQWEPTCLVECETSEPALSLRLCGRARQAEVGSPADPITYPITNFSRMERASRPFHPPFWGRDPRPATRDPRPIV